MRSSFWWGNSSPLLVGAAPESSSRTLRPAAAGLVAPGASAIKMHGIDGERTQTSNRRSDRPPVQIKTAWWQWRTISCARVCGVCSVPCRVSRPADANSTKWLHHACSLQKGW
jgi:hypothetical protein